MSAASEGAHAIACVGSNSSRHPEWTIEDHAKWLRKNGYTITPAVAILITVLLGEDPTPARKPATRGRRMLFTLPPGFRKERTPAGHKGGTAWSVYSGAGYHGDVVRSVHRGRTSWYAHANDTELGNHHDFGPDGAQAAADVVAAAPAWHDPYGGTP